MSVLNKRIAHKEGGKRDRKYISWILQDWNIYIDDFAVSTRSETAGERALTGRTRASGSGAFD